ncbi:MAG: YSC84-related protein [Rhodanobacter sp.]
MKKSFVLASGMALLLWAAASWANAYSDAAALFRHSSQSSSFFSSAYGYALFPTIGKGGFVVGAAHGVGQVYVHGKHVGDTSMTQLSIGAQLGGQAYSQIMFFQNKAAFDTFKAGNFEFDAGASAVAITAAAGATAGTQGVSGNASGDKRDANTAGGYYKGVAVFTIVKGGAMYQATVAGQKFTYTPR